MSDRVHPGPIQEGTCIREAVCIHTRKIYDSCKDKDCIEDLRIYPTAESQAYIDNAVSIRTKSAELLYVSTDVEEISFNRGYYTVDVRYFYHIRGEAMSHIQKPREISGLAVFDKRVILFGSEGSAKIFTSDTNPGALSFRELKGSNLPIAVVEAVDPIVLNMKLVEVGDFCGCECDVTELPDCISSCFGGELVLEQTCRRVYATLGQFSIIRLERDSQLLIPAYDYCMPEKECLTSGEDDPCSLFSRIAFPINEFFPPDTMDCPEGYREACSALMG